MLQHWMSRKAAGKLPFRFKKVDKAALEATLKRLRKKQAAHASANAGTSDEEEEGFECFGEVEAQQDEELHLIQEDVSDSSAEEGLWSQSCRNLAPAPTIAPTPAPTPASAPAPAPSPSPTPAPSPAPSPAPAPAPAPISIPAPVPTPTCSQSPPRLLPHPRPRPRPVFPNQPPGSGSDDSHAPSGSGLAPQSLIQESVPSNQVSGLNCYITP